MKAEFPSNHPDWQMLDIYFLAYNEIMNGILIYDLNSRLIFANDYILMRLSEAQLNGLWDTDIKDILDQILAGSMPYEGIEIKPKNGYTAKSFLVSGKPFCLGGGSYIILTLTDITNYAMQKESLLCKLEQDYFTEALNKFGLNKQINKLIAAPDQNPFTICMLDFDGFKQINDNFGHLTGDEVLRTFAHISRKSIRGSDIFGRYGGEEFVFVFTNTGIEKSSRILTRIQSELRRCFSSLDPYTVTISAGMLHVDPRAEPRLDYQALIHKIDTLLYTAKANGKSRIVTPLKEYRF